MGLVYWTLVWGADSDLASGLSHPMDDGDVINYKPSFINYTRNA